VAVAKDGTVEVQLNSNPTTGYTWQVACKPGQTLSLAIRQRNRVRATPGQHSNWAQPLVADTPAQGTGHVLKRALVR
jgi:predicted secreted protein